MTAETDTRLEEVCMALNLLGSLCKWRLIVARVKSFHRVREESLIAQDEKQRILLQHIDLRYLANIKYTSRLSSGFSWPTIGQIDSSVGTVN